MIENAAKYLAQNCDDMGLATDAGQHNNRFR